MGAANSIISDMRGAGFSEDEIRNAVSPDAENMRTAGFSENEISEVFGIPTNPPFDPQPAVDAVNQSIEQATSSSEGEGEGTKKDFSFTEAVEAGFQQSIFGLAAREKVPDIIVGEDASAVDRITSQVAAMTLDLPVFALGGAIAAPGGGGLLSPATATAGAFALPAALRSILIDTYENGQIASFSDFWEVFSGAFIEGGKGFVTGAAVGVAGPVAGVAALKVTGPIAGNLTVPVAEKAAQIAALVTMGSALEGEVPNASDFTDAAVVIGVLTLGGKGAGKLRSVYRNTGVKPERVLEESGKNPTVNEDLASKNLSETPRAFVQVKPATKAEVVKEVDAKLKPEVADAVRGNVAEPEARPTEVEIVTKRGKTIGLVGGSLSDNITGSPKGSLQIGGQHIDSDMMRHARKGNGKRAMRRLIDPFLKDGKHVASSDQLSEAANGVYRSLIKDGYEVEVHPNILRDIDGNFVTSDGRPPYKIVGVGVSGSSGGGKKPSALEEVKERISFSQKEAKKPFRERLDSIYADWFREQHPLGKAVKEMADGAEVPIVENAAKLAQLEPGVVARASHFLEFSPIDFKTFNDIGKPLKVILEPHKNNLQDFSAYLVARRTVELSKNRKAAGKVDPEKPLTGIPLDVAKRAVADGSKKFEAAAAELSEFQGHVLAYMRDSGLISKESFDLLRAAGENYVPLNRVMDGSNGITSGSGGKNARDPLFRFRGSDLEIVDPIESVVKNTYLFISIAERNQIGLQLTRQAAETGSTGVASRVKEKTRPIAVKPEELKRAIDKWSKGKELTESEANILEGFAENEFNVFRPNGLRPGDNQIAVFDKGKRTVWDIDPEVYRVFRAGNDATNGLLMKAMAPFARTLRAGAILDPGFIAKNPLRDQIPAFVFSENKLKMFVDFAKGIGSVIRRDADFQKWQKSGGPQSALVSLDRTTVRKNVHDIIGGSARNRIKSPLELLRILSELSESGTRVGEFKRAMKGKEPTKENLLSAGLDSRNVALDFSQMGTSAREMNQIIPFFAAAMNDLDRNVRVVKDHPVRTMARIGGAIVVPSVLLHLHNRDQDWYKETAQWEKDIFWLIHINDTTYRYPKPFGMGTIYGTGSEKVVDALIGMDPNAFDGFREAVFRATLPGFMPAAITPIVETFAKRKVFFDSPVVPKRLESQLPEYQYTQYTTELTKALGRHVAQLPGMKNSVVASPLVIENFVQSWTGGLGKNILNLVDLTLRKSGVLPDPVRPEITLSDIPGIKSFVSRHPTMNTQPVQDFFDNFARNETTINTINRLTKEGNIEAAERERKIAGVSGTANLKAYQRTISESVKLIRQIWNPNFDIPVQERQQITDNYYIMINQTAQAANEMMERLEKIEREEGELE